MMITIISIITSSSSNRQADQNFGFDPRQRQAKVLKTGSSGFPPWCSGVMEYHLDWPASVRVMDWLVTGLKKKKKIHET